MSILLLCSRGWQRPRLEFRLPFFSLKSQIWRHLCSQPFQRYTHRVHPPRVKRWQQDRWDDASRHSNNSFFFFGSRAAGGAVSMARSGTAGPEPPPSPLQLVRRSQHAMTLCTCVCVVCVETNWKIGRTEQSSRHQEHEAGLHCDVTKGQQPHLSTLFNKGEIKVAVTFRPGWIKIH